MSPYSSNETNGARLDSVGKDGKLDTSLERSLN
jgi:hypothetical protein